MKKRGTEQCWQGAFLNAFILSYEDKKGAMRTWEGVARVNCGGVVVIVPFTPEGDVILVRQYRPLFDGPVLEFPAGLVECGESPADAARRELIEETGYMPAHIRFLLKGPLSSGMTTEMLEVYLALDVTPASGEVMKRFRAEENESIDVVRVEGSRFYETVRFMEQNGDLVDPKIYGFFEMGRRER